MLPFELVPLAVVFSLPLPLVIQLVITVFLPLLVGLVTTRVTAPDRKAVLLLVLSVFSSGLNELLTSLNSESNFDAGLWLLSAVGTFVGGVALHYGLWKKVGASYAAQRAFNGDGDRDPE